MIRGDTGEFKATFNDENNTPIDDPGAEYRMTVKKRVADADAQEIFSVTANQSNPGIAFLTIPPSATRPLAPVTLTLFYDVQVTESGGRITTIQFGNFIVTPDISITTP
jgi:hypothetical protein